MDRARAQLSAIQLVLLVIAWTNADRVSSRMEIISGPQNQTVMLHGNAVFTCEVSNVKNLKDVYWHREPGFDVIIWDECYSALESTMRSSTDPTECDQAYSITAVRNGHTVFWRLEVLNVSLNYDRVTFHCNPSGLQASAMLTVMVPPTQIIMENYRSGSRIDFDENETVRTFRCLVMETKLLSNFSIDWYVNGELRSESVTTPGIDPELLPRGQLNSYVGEFNLTRNMLLTNEDTRVECRVDRRNSFVQKNVSSHVIIVQTRSPSQPTVDWDEARTYHVNEVIHWSCETRGGWPEPSVTWYRDGIPIDHSFESAKNGERRSVNTLTRHIREEDNQAEYRCEVWNSEGETRKKKVASVLNVTYNPRIFGFWRTDPNNPTEPITNQTEPITLGDLVALRCDVLGNPRASVNFSLAGIEAPADSSTSRFNYNDSTRLLLDGRAAPRGIETSSIKVFQIERTQARSITFGCISKNGNDRDAVRSTLGPIKIAHPPTSVHIEGEVERIAYEDSRLYLRCIAVDADPPADFSWKIVYANGTEKSLVRSAHATTSRGSVDTSELRDVVVHRDMTQSIIVCEVSHRALRDRVLSHFVRMTVRFAVREVLVVPKANPIVENRTAEITCSTDYSFPKPQLRWQLGGTDNFYFTVFNSQYTGNDTIGYRVVESIHYQMQYTDDKKTVYCTAETPYLTYQKSHGYQQIVHYSPRIPLISDKILNEFQPFELEVNVRANPHAEYKWRKNREDFTDGMHGGSLKATGTRLESTRLNRKDNGTYELLANNTIGRNSVSFLIYVRYIDVPVVSHISKDKKSTIICKYSADPPPRVWIGLSKDAGDSNKKWVAMDRISGEYQFPVNHNRGKYKYMCVVENAVGQQSSPVEFQVVRRVMLLKTAPLTTAAVDNEKSRAVLRCVADSPSMPRFTWKRNGHDLQGNTTLHITTRAIDGETFESTLEILGAGQKDMGGYVCLSSNEEGSDTVVIDLVAPRGPDEPQNLTSVNATDTSITISWNAGFNGGADQKFLISYREVDENSLSRDNTQRFLYYTPASQTDDFLIFAIRNLKPNTEYEISVKAQSKNGETRFIDSVYRRTELQPPLLTELMPLDLTNGQTPLIIITGICIAAMFLLVVNVLLICVCVRNKKRRQQPTKKYALNGMEMLNAASPIFDPASAAMPLLNTNQFISSPLHSSQVPNGSANDMFTSIESVPNGVMANRMSPPAQLYVPDLNDPQVVELVDRMPPDTLKTYSRLDNTLDGFNDDLYKVYQKVLFHEPSASAQNGGMHKTINLERNFNRPTPDVLNNLDVVHQQANLGPQRTNLDSFSPVDGTMLRQNGGLPWPFATTGRHSTAELLDPRNANPMSASMNMSSSVHNTASSIPIPSRTSSKQMTLNSAKRNGYRPSLGAVVSDQETPFGSAMNCDMPPRAPSPDLPSPNDDYDYERKTVTVHTLPNKRHSRKVRISEGHVV